MRIANVIFLFVAISIVLFGCGCSVVKQAPYKVVDKQGSLELREYAPQVLAQTIAEGSFEDAGNEGFTRLFKFITGNNKEKASIAMTAPVGRQASGRKIPMTTPVGRRQSSNGWLISFVMPVDYTLATTPQPLDGRIELREIPARLVASVTFSGTWSQKRYEERKASLDAFIRDKGLKVEDESTFAGYDSPFTLWFLRRNEVLIPVSRP